VRFDGEIVPEVVVALWAGVLRRVLRTAGRLAVGNRGIAYEGEGGHGLRPSAVMAEGGVICREAGRLQLAVELGAASGDLAGSCE